ncbi:site-specific integrase [Desulfallas sp. Bu1-1]|uniref:tyrosine-type recombinase/integrase n=1 Tax=Desulfallas sp. Bu1-1 TaxID=2787620 RepID=UPI00189FFD72|nr:tyrosine-type recombinase/integrase [Desulfallas sp. Bu1-1]MBF7084192.1 site-specific integrase [Desulfallas sp. Bu1-1]
MARRGNGEGTICKRNNGTWEAKITIGYNHEGKPKRLTKYFKTRKEAQEWLAKIQHEKATGKFVEPHKTTVGEWLERWLNDYAKPKTRVTTWNSYEALIRQHIKPVVGDIPLVQLQPADLQRLYNFKRESGRLDGKGGLSPRTVRYLHTVIHAALAQAVKEGLIYRNVAEAVTLPKQERKELKPLTREQTLQFLDAAKEDRLYPAFLLAVYSGLQRGELLALRWQDVDLKEHTITIRQSINRTYVSGGGTKTKLTYLQPKTEKSRRTIPIPAEVVQELRRHKAKQARKKLLGQTCRETDLVFTAEKGGPIDPRNLARKFETLLKKAGLPKVRFHDLRHGFATMLLKANEHPKTVQELLGHSTITTTLDIYSHVDEDIKKRAVEKISYMLQKEKSPHARG